MNIYHFFSILAAISGIFLMAFGLKIRFRISETLHAGQNQQDEYLNFSPQIYQRSGFLKWGLFFVIIAGVLEIWALGIPVIAEDTFPSEKDIQSFSYALEHKNPDHVSVNELKAFLQKIANPKDVYQAVFVEDFFKFLSTLYLKTEDENILLAVDDLPIDGNAANMVCGFYGRIIQREKAIHRYKANRLPIQRCIGLSISPEDYKKLVE
ncbi:MAG: hypothetical protein EHJ94_09610 [Deltaproteobacteria bacterium]|nr:MAG: hypothetical protein EHJ94_09610 [Deltaproteobacteria bacterium]